MSDCPQRASFPSLSRLALLKRAVSRFGTLDLCAGHLSKALLLRPVQTSRFSCLIADQASSEINGMLVTDFSGS